MSLHDLVSWHSDDVDLSDDALNVVWRFRLLHQRRRKVSRIDTKKGQTFPWSVMLTAARGNIGSCHLIWDIWLLKLVTVSPREVPYSSVTLRLLVLRD